MEDKTYTPEEIRTKFDSLPTDVKSLVYSADMLNLVKQLGDKYKLHLDKLEILESETADVMTGFTKPENFSTNLKEALEIDQKTADAIALDVNNELFVKIRDSLKQLYGQSALPVSTPAASVSKPTPPMRDISVVMPSKATSTAPNSPPEATRSKTVAPPMPPAAPQPMPVAPKPVVLAAPAPAPQVPSHAPEMMLSETTVSVPQKPTTPAPVVPPPTTPAAAPTPASKPMPPSPSSYKTDPYREPPE